jgi:NADH-quinone oxidoreductase subunit N
MNAIYVISGLGILSLVSEIFNFKKGLNALVMLGLATSSFLLIKDWDIDESYFNNMIVLNSVTRGFILLMVLVTASWIWMAADYLNPDETKTDRTSLILFVLTGGTLMVSFGNLAMLFLGIETLSLSLYTLAGSRKNSLSSTEAAFKYFLMGSFATGFFLFGVALVYGATGSFDVTSIYVKLNNQLETIPAFFNVGVILILVGLAFKISAVPFHFWAPDVYEGAPTHITALMATLVKIAGIVALYQILTMFITVHKTWMVLVDILTVLTLLIPNVAAVLQSSAKRMLAYSSVGHVGFLLMAMLTLVGNFCPDCTYNQPHNTIFFYLAAYVVASLAAFNAVAIVEKNTGHVSIANFKGLFKRSPLLAVSLTIALLSLAGIPPLAGFFGKYMVFVLVIQQGYGLLALLGVLASLIGVYYYFRIIAAMYFQEGHGEAIEISRSIKVWMYVMIALSFGLTVFADFVTLP